MFLARKRYEDGHWGGWVKVVAINKKGAAEVLMYKYEFEDTEFPVGSGQEEAEVQVKKEGGEVTTYTVTGEAMPVYTATKNKT